MKSRVLIIIVAITIVAITIGVIVASIVGTMEYQSTYNQNCNSDGGKIVGFLKCIYINEDFTSPESLQVTDSLTIPNAERDVKLAAGYKLYPGVGWVHPDDLGNQKPIYIDNPNNPGELILDLDAMIKAEESKQEKTPSSEPPFEKEEPFTKIEIMFGERLDDKLVPVIFTEVTTSAETLDEIMVWKFQLIGNSGDDRRVVWDALPKDKRISYEITDDDGLDIRIPENFISIPFDLHGYKMDCGLFQTVYGESAHPTLWQIKNNTSTIYAQNSRMGIYPDSNEEYSFEFASIFKNYVSFPEDAVEIISQNTRECKLTNNVEDDPTGKYTDGYYTKMTFRFN